MDVRITGNEWLLPTFPKFIEYWVFHFAIRYFSWAEFQYICEYQSYYKIQVYIAK